MGLSYYPVWHGAMRDLARNMVDLSSRFSRPVIVVETAYPWTQGNGDQQQNIYTHTGPETYPMTPMGQRDFLWQLLREIHGVPQGRGLGFFYWEPEFIAVAGAGWKRGAGNEWDNVTPFDADGRALPALRSLALAVRSVTKKE